MSSSDPHEQEAARLAATLRAIQGDAPPPDDSVLEEIKRRALDAFLESAKTPAPDRILTSTPRKARPAMITFVLRSAAAIAATVAIVAGWLNLGPHPVSGAVPFAEVLAKLTSARTLQLRATKEGTSAQVWVRAPGEVRWEESPERYRIASGSRLWKIDESTNSIVADKAAWFNESQQQVNLLGLLEVGVEDSAALLAARPTEQGRYAGRECRVYRVDLAGREGELQIEAFADVRDNQLVGITARPVGAARDVAPLAELQLVAMNAEVDETKFVVAKSLTEDGRIGKVVEAQGVVVLRPVLAKRWTPICRETLLKPGDWVRTDLRGPNAVKLRLASEVELTLGPGTLLECISPAQARLHAGEIQCNRPQREDRVAFELLAPREGSRKFDAAGKTVLRVDREEKLVNLKEPPRWLAGFEGTSANESLGSLIVRLPDGRNEPLSVGYHKVSVEIRDQIARTTIEESFVNHTAERLEGVFHFPLPQDASISGFGMWIGNDLIEADIVEKQRAREIFETMLRERRDPGLLEWTSGNLFKARVFPIEAHAEKRVKIVYTQVLPLRGSRYRYTYNLRSELLRTKPVRELSLAVQVNSALPLKSVTCPTHSARTQQTEHAAQVEFSAQEYSPERDFEVVCEVGEQNSDVVVVPHRRGEDGYFLLQLTPPSAAGNWQRDVLPDGKPIELVLLCDTSASMDAEKRKQQTEFVATMLSALGKEDRFLLAAADVGTVWASPEPMSATPENIGKVREFLDGRVSLGWTNLDQAFEAVLKKAPADAQVVYLGDGIVSAGDTDPASFVKRLGRLIAGAKPAEGASRRTFHAVTVGNTHEVVVLRGIAEMGGGSVRTIGGEQTPLAVARELLNEIAQPGLRDVNVEFRGLKVAALYPDRLPQVAAGTQQILVGRYLPTGKDQQGEVIVTGKLGAEPVRYVAKVDLKDAEAGNSFIPRLWARAHLDHLLAQGSSQTIREEVIGLSEQFHIITPYTSLLVLETDADRERFGVKRRYEMRDGERFFVEGRDNANYELLQQQMKLAGNWRLELRRNVFRDLAQLGRDAKAFEWGRDYNGNGPDTLTRLGLFATSTIKTTGRMRSDDLSGRFNGIWNGPLKTRALADFDALEEVITTESDPLGDTDDLLFFDGSSSMGHGEADEFLSDLEGGSLSGGLPARSRQQTPFKAGIHLSSSNRGYLGGRWSGWDEAMEVQNPLGMRRELSEGKYKHTLDVDYTVAQPFYEHGRDIAYTICKPVYESLQTRRPNDTDWLEAVFPWLAGPPQKPKAQKDPENWSPEALVLSKSLLRIPSLLKLEEGIELQHVSETFDPVWNRRTAHHSERVLYSTKSWLTRPLDSDDHTLVNYCNHEERGVFSLAFLLGRTRASVDRDLKTPPFSLADSSFSVLHESYRNYQARVEPAGENQVRLILTLEDSTLKQHFLIDTAKHVLVKQESFDKNRLTGTTTYADFVEVVGSWWARNVIVTDAKGRKIGETKLEVKTIAPQQYAERIAAELAAKPRVQFLRLPFVSLKKARQRVADGSASFDDRLTMMLSSAKLQQWDELFKQFDAAEKLAADKSGISWLRTVLLMTSRRNEETRQRLLDKARELAAHQQQDELYLAEFILLQAEAVASVAEYLEFVRLLQPVYDRYPAETHVKTRWQEHLLNAYDQLGRRNDALALRRSLAEQMPWDVQKQADYANWLMQLGQTDAAFAWLRKELDRPVERNLSDDNVLRTAYANLYRTQGRWEDLLRFTAQWIERNPEYSSAYSEHLSALIYNEQLDAANALAEQWLKESQVDGELKPDQRARLNAAISFAQGNAPHLSFHYVDDRWCEPLVETARFFTRHKHHFDVAKQIVDDYRFSNSDASDRLRGYFLTRLRTELNTLRPEQIFFLVNWTLSGRMELTEPIAGRKQLTAQEIPDDVWRNIAAELRQRWAQSPNRHDKNTLGEALRTIYADRFSETELLPFLRERLTAVPAEYKSLYVNALFEALLNRTWTDDIEQETFQRWRELSDADEPGDRLIAQLPALYRLVDGMIANRQTRAEQELRDQGKLDQLTRTEMRKKETEMHRAAMAGVAARLAKEAEKETGPLGPWLRIEQAYLNLQLDQNLAQAAEQAWQILDEVPPKPKADEETLELTPSQAQERYLDAALRQRALATVMNLAARRNAQPADVERVLKYIDAGIGQGDDAAAPWRMIKFNLLIALDRPDDLERELRNWIRTDVSTAPWRNLLALLLAERGRLEEAISLFEAAEKDQLLSAEDYQTLANWYLVTKHREAYERSRIEAFKQTPEHALNNRLSSVRDRWLRTDQPLPSELDEETLFVFRALFEKSPRPENYLWQLRELYGACRDFRLLHVLPHAVLGRSPQQIYPFLQQLQNQVLHELRNEAAADELIAQIHRLREKKLTSTDLRALDLLEALVERRSSEVLNQPGPHAEACLAALKRAFERQWGESEPRMMASFLANLGTLRHPSLIDEQIRELRALQAAAIADSRDHLQITNELCNALFWSYQRYGLAIAEMETEVRAYEQANQGRWPHQDNDVLGSYVHLLEGATRHAAGEAVLLKRLAQPENSDQRDWLQVRLVTLYNDALDRDSEVTLGRGNTLFVNLVAHEQKQLDAAPQEQMRYSIVDRLTKTLEIARQHKLASVHEELHRFAFEVMPKVLKRQQDQYRNTVIEPLSVITDVLGPKLALQYVVERMEQYPKRFDFGWENAWNTFGSHLAHLRYVAVEEKKMNLKELEPRVLKLALDELRRDLRTDEGRNRTIYHKSYGHNSDWFWAAKADDFARVADEFYAEHKTSGRLAQRVADYLWQGLQRFPRAIEILLVAHRDGILDESGQDDLIRYLHDQQRFAESIPILEPLVQAKPDSMHYRTLLMTAYFRSQRPEQLLDLVRQTDEHFHQKGRWEEDNIAEFGKGCLGCNLAEKAMGYLSEAISLHQRNNPDSSNDAALSGMHQQLAQAHSLLGHTKEAVDAASGAIVCWGSQTDERRDALKKLNQVLAESKDLPSYVHQLDQQAAETGQDSPILRKAIGQVYQSRSEHARAIAQFKLALPLQPNDKEIHQALIAAYDATGQKREATLQLLQFIDLEPHNLSLHQQLAERLKDNEAEAERAATSMIEAGPQEAENHTAMAEFRQKQNRWSEAIDEWAAVARLRSLEPTGLVKLAEAQLHEQRWDVARQSIDKLQKTEWPARFNDISNQIRHLQEQLPR